MIQKPKEILERSITFSVHIIHLSDFISTKNLVNEVILKQLIRCGTSVGANIVEAQAGSSRKDFTNFLLIALKSANETWYWLELLHRSRSQFDSVVCPLQREIHEISLILGSSIRSLRTKH